MTHRKMNLMALTPYILVMHLYAPYGIFIFYKHISINMIQLNEVIMSKASNIIMYQMFLYIFKYCRELR